MDRDIKVQDLQSHCRTCLAEYKGFKYDVGQLPPEIFQLFKQATGSSKSHSRFFPKWICDSCCVKINSFSEFRVMSKKSTQFLEELIKSYNTRKTLVGNIESETPHELKENDSKQKSELSMNNNIEEECERAEIPQEKTQFENVFLQTDLKADHFEIVQPFVDPTDALSITNANSSNENDIPVLECNIKIEGKTPSEEDIRDRTCKVCSLAHSTTGAFNAHMRSHQDEKNVQCFECNSEFKTKSQLQEHVEVSPDCGTTMSQQIYTDSMDEHKNSQFQIEINSDEMFKNDLSKRTCKICNKTFASATTLKSHTLSHEEETRFQCDQCNVVFDRKIQLKKHIQEMHAKKPLKINCKFGCGKTFLRIQTALTHYKMKHHPKEDTAPDTVQLITSTIEETKRCEQMAEQLADSSKFNAEAIILPIINKTTCKVCFRNYSSEQKLKIHMRLHDETRPFQCDQCERSFNEKSRLKRHVAETHTNNDIEIDCKFGCGKTFRRIETLKKHYYLKHSPAEKEIKPKTYTFICENCGRVFKNITAMREHSYTHLPAEDRPYKCEECSKSFTSKRSYKDHLTRHAGIKKYECTYCGLKKTTRKELKHHLNIHTKEKTFTCSVCAKVFNRMSGLKMHERVVHQGIRLYNCSYCDLSFGKPDTLKHHEMRHTGEKPHKCQNCDRSFIQVVALRAHMKTHNK